MSTDTVVRARIDSEYKGNLIGARRRSARDSLFDDAIATFEEDACAYDQKDAEGFI